MALKSSDAWCVPLCITCHAEFDQGHAWTKEQKRALMDEWIILTIDALARQGLVRA